MKKLITLLFSLALITQIGNAQSTGFEGNWLLTEVEISVQGNDETALTTSNFIWRDVYRDKSPVLFTKDGQLIFKMDNEPVVSTYKIEADELIISFTSKQGIVSSTSYQIRKNGSEMLLSRKDPLVSERYIFKFN